MPGSIVALIVVITGALAGARMGALAAAAGGALFYLTVADRGSVSSPMATLVSTGIWVVAALVAGYLAESLRAEVERRRAAAVALGKAAAVREAELAEQRRVEGLAAELRVEREQLLTMIEQTDTSIVILDRDFNFLVANSAFSRSAGRDAGGACRESTTSRSTRARRTRSSSGRRATAWSRSSIAPSRSSTRTSLSAGSPTGTGAWRRSRTRSASRVRSSSRWWM